MPRSRAFLLALCAAFALALFLSASALAAGPVLRPTEGGPYPYTVPEAAPYVTAHVVVHYVTSSVDAPPLNDDNGNGVPDYVEQVSQAAEKSLTAYAAAGYMTPKDYGWPNELPDIYIHALPAGLFGETYAPVAAEGGTFVVVSNRLDPSLKAFGSLQATVAHELFHVIQYTYIPNGELPPWVAEGQASAMEFIVYPEVQDVVSNEYLDNWLSKPYLPLYDELDGCSHCYGGSLWWYALNQADPGLIREYLGRLWGYQQDGRKLLLATQPLDEILKKRGFSSLYQTYTRFSLQVYRAGLAPGDAYHVQATRKVKTTRVWRVDGLSTHYIPVKNLSSARGLDLAVANGGGPPPSVTLILGGPKGRVVKPKLSHHGHEAFFDVRFKSAAERKTVMLVITSGRQDGVAYKAAYEDW